MDTLTVEKRAELRKEAWYEFQAMTPLADHICRDVHYDQSSHMKAEPKADDEVCDREKAWRKYCRLRDGADYYLCDKQ